MKKTYEKAEFKIVEFTAEDIISTSATKDVILNSSLFFSNDDGLNILDY